MSQLLHIHFAGPTPFLPSITSYPDASRSVVEESPVAPRPLSCRPVPSVAAAVEDDPATAVASSIARALRGVCSRQSAPSRTCLLGPGAGLAGRTRRRSLHVTRRSLPEQRRALDAANSTPKARYDATRRFAAPRRIRTHERLGTLCR